MSLSIVPVAVPPSKLQAFTIEVNNSVAIIVNTVIANLENTRIDGVVEVIAIQSRTKPISVTVSVQNHKLSYHAQRRMME